MPQSITIGALAGMSRGDCGQRILKMQVPFSREQHNFREIKLALESLLNADIPVERTEPTTTATSYIRSATVTSGWVKAGDFWTAQSTDDSSGDNISLLMPYIGSFEPSLENGDNVYYGQDANQDAYVVTEFADAVRGTVRFDINVAPQPVPGWGWADGVGNYTASAQQFMGWMYEDEYDAGLMKSPQSVDENISGIDLVISSALVKDAEADPVMQPEQPQINPKRSGVVLGPHLNVTLSDEDIDGTVVPKSVTLEPYFYATTATGVSSSVETDNSRTNIVLAMAGQHNHEWVKEEISFNTDFPKSMTFQDTMDPNGLHRHVLDDDGHTHTSGGHSHGLSDPNGHTHANSAHPHTMAGVSHDHGGSMTLVHEYVEKEHTHIQVPHTHAVSASGHDHPVEADLTQDEWPHNHFSMRPKRVRLAVFERIPRGAV